ncbi:Uu.00g143250.m01.CDS01 [Anthostomella pinea]|uniref:Uu.00g143250.m01.CDS01 n=1 Tax=Anthostomella pinea TaxID=933095 RepID=A0AAI8VRF8_9PEZI|nr:Uu.00g143250.m01.CDS01 [Anthostomella pinea]
MSFISKITVALLGLASAVAAAPAGSCPATQQPPSKPACVPGTKIAIWQPEMWTIYPSNPTAQDSPVTGLNLVRHAEASINEALAVFTGIPKEAKTCTLGWGASVKGERTETFFVKDNGNTEWLQVPGKPPGKVTWNSVRPYVLNGGKSSGLDLTGGSDTDAAVAGIGCQLDCAETMYLYGIITDASAGSIFLDQDFQNGLNMQVTG